MRCGPSGDKSINRYPVDSFPATARCYPGHHPGAALQHQPDVVGPLAAVYALYQNPGRGINKNRHFMSAPRSRSLSAYCAAASSQLPPWSRTLPVLCHISSADSRFLPVRDPYFFTPSGLITNCGRLPSKTSAIPRAQIMPVSLRASGELHIAYALGRSEHRFCQNPAMLIDKKLLFLGSRMRKEVLYVKKILSEQKHLDMQGRSSYRTASQRQVRNSCIGTYPVLLLKKELKCQSDPSCQKVAGKENDDGQCCV